MTSLRTIAAILVATSFASVMPLANADVPSCPAEGQEFVVSDDGTIPSHWHTAPDVMAMTWPEYLVCFVENPSPPDDAATIVSEPGGDNPMNYASTPSESPGIVIPSADEQDAAGVGTSFQIIVIPSKHPDNRPDSQCNLDAFRPMRDTLQSYFFIRITLYCYGNAWLSTGLGGADHRREAEIFLEENNLIPPAQGASAIAYGVGLVKCWDRNGVAAGRTALVAEHADDTVVNCQRPYEPKNPPDWQERIIAQHEVSHLWGADGDRTWDYSVMHYYGAFRGDTWYYKTECAQVNQFIRGQGCS